MLRARQLFVLSGLTAAEAIRQPICLLLTGSCVLLTALTPMLIMHVFGEEGKLARDSGLALHFVFGLFVAGHAACSTLSREMRVGTASVVLSKPVGRTTFFFSKFLGVACVVLAFSVCAMCATLLSERIAERYVMTPHMAGWVTDWQTGRLLAAAPFVACVLAGVINYLFKRPFEQTAFALLLCAVLAVLFISGFFDRSGRPVPLDFAVLWRIVPAGLLVTLALLVLAAVALALSTRLSTVPTLAITAAVFLGGLMSDHLFGRFADTSVAARFVHRVLPNWQHFWVSDALTGGGTIPWSYVLQTALYAAATVVGLLCIGAVSLRHVEMK